MNKLARLPAIDRATRASARHLPRAHRHSTRYFAFLSYSHKDEQLARWLQAQLEQFRVPRNLAGQLTEHGVIPKRLSPVFRDQHELAAADDLGEEIEEALANSQFLIVLCSPDAARSRWVNAEVETFKRTRPDGCVLAAIASGEPFASELPGRKAEECFPPALRQKYDRRGRPTGKRAEPLAADLRQPGEGRRLGLMKLIAGMLGVGLDDLVQRDATRRQRRLGMVAAASLAGMAITSTLAVAAIQARDAAREQRRQAEGLVAFMLGDLKDKLEPIGRLDALDGVGSRVLAYYQNEDTSDLSDAALLQRSQALSLTAEVAYERGKLADAQKLYREALAGTAEAIRRNPDDPQRIYDHAQNVFWLADIDRQLGHLPRAEAGMREYKRLADRMVELAPDNMKWRIEQQSADFNLGVLLFEQRKFVDATAQFVPAFQQIQALTTADPHNRDYQVQLTESEAWLADAQASQGQLGEATNQYEQLTALLNRLLAQTGDVEYRQKLVTAERYLGRLYENLGEMQNALTHFRASVTHSAALIAVEPANSRWRSFGARANLDLAEALLAAGQKDEAASAATAGCNAAMRLISTDAKVQTWRGDLAECSAARAQLAAAAGNFAQAASFARSAVSIAATVQSTDPVEDKFALARDYRLLGDARQRLNDPTGALAAWQQGLAAIPPNVAEKPSEMAEHVLLLERLGKQEEARARTERLAAIGYRDPQVRNVKEL